MVTTEQRPLDSADYLVSDHTTRCLERISNLEPTLVESDTLPTERNVFCEKENIFFHKYRLSMSKVLLSKGRKQNPNRQIDRKRGKHRPSLEPVV